MVVHDRTLHSGQEGKELGSLGLITILPGICLSKVYKVPHWCTLQTRAVSASIAQQRYYPTTARMFRDTVSIHRGSGF